MEIFYQNKLLFPEILAPREKEVHKKSVGQVMIVAGSRGMTGAAILACEAAMRAGAGVVLLAFPEGLQDIFKKLPPEIMTIACKETEDQTLALAAFDDIFEKAQEFDVILMGPGLSQHEETRHLICKLYKYSKQKNKRVVLDADGLNAFSGHVDLLEKQGDGKTILLPHSGEMARLCNRSVDYVKRKRKWYIRKKAKKWDSIVVYKGYETIISNGEETVMNETGGPALATAGTGDVLAGIVGAFWAANLKEHFEAAATAVYIHGLAGDLAARELGERSVMASDVIEYLPLAIKKSTR